jgi:hypothetical protein
MKLQIIETPDYILAVSDEEMKTGDIGYDTEYGIRKCVKIKAFYEKDEVSPGSPNKKIIAYQQKGDAPELDLPLLPEIVVKDYSLEAAKKFAYSKFENLKDKYPLGKGMTTIQAIFDVLEAGVDCGYKFASKANKVVVEDDVEKLAYRIYPAINTIDENGNDLDLNYGYRRGFEEGLKYKAATKVYSEEDLRKAFRAGMEFIGEDKGSYDEFIQSLKQPKTPKWFVVEMEYYGETLASASGFSMKTEPILKLIAINGKTYLVGTYLYE